MSLLRCVIAFVVIFFNVDTTITLKEYAYICTGRVRRYKNSNTFVTEHSVLGDCNVTKADEYSILVWAR